MCAASPPVQWTTVMLAGGRGSRLGNDDKAAVTISGTSALDHLLASLLAADMPWAGGLLQRLIAEFASCEAAALVPVDRSRLTTSTPRTTYANHDQGRPPW